MKHPKTIERVCIEPPGESPLPEITCSRCSGSAVLEGDLTKEHRTRNLAIDFVFTGWRCEACGETFATDEVNDQISRVADARLVALGLRPAVDLEAVAAIKQAEQTRSRTSTRG